MATERNIVAPTKSAEKIEAQRLEVLTEWRKGAKRQMLAESSFDPGTYGCHEAFHTAWVLLDAIAGQLLEHPSIIKDPGWYRHAFKAHEELFRLYQKMGAAHLPAIPSNEAKPADRTEALK